MLKNIKIYTSDIYWKHILTDLGAIIVDSSNVADVVFDDIDVNVPISVMNLKNLILYKAENKDIIHNIFGHDVLLPRLQHQIIVALSKNPDITMVELKNMIGILPNVTTHSVENAIYQLRKNYGRDFIINDNGKYKIGRL